MIRRLPLIIGLISIPLILLMVVPQTNIDCGGNAMCITGKITHIVDGDTIDVGNTRVRLA